MTTCNVLININISFTDSEQSPGVYLRDDPVFGTQLQNHSELRVPTAERAAFYLDAAMDSRGATKDHQRDSHLLYTLHVYQYSVAGKGGGKLQILIGIIFLYSSEIIL